MSNERDGVNEDRVHLDANPLPNWIHRVQVRSAHKWIFENLLFADCGNCHVHSVYEKTVNFFFEENFITLTSTEDGPATIVAGGPLPHLDPGNAVDPALLFDFTSAVAWAPPDFQINSQCLNRNTLDDLRETIGSSGKSALLKAFFSPWVVPALSALARDFPQFDRGGGLLIGLGPGLTPSGDDFMSGFCHVLAHTGFQGLWEQIAPSAERTNLISRKMLRWACLGVAARPFENALVGLSQGSPDSSKRIQEALTIGHCSGADHLLGVWFCLMLLHKRQTEGRI